ncbi:uncharacterized protein LOC116352461 [Contarinia nasturtii]|uniref:uncharacterized protein LOC116352461 n=1 Tax=Contarinia nasturtii TaxID=265458 RepID=UPI0012D47E33|nr:uncharacterized protein LOC116352461 [Contarinia nasturtii]
MKYHHLTAIYVLFGVTLFVHQIHAKNTGENVKEPNTQVVPSVPSLPTGQINGNTVDCVNSKFFKIQRENPQLGPWLTDVQRTVENLFAVRKKCETQTKSRQSECISAWNRAAGVQFLRLGLSLFEQDNPKGNQLEILNVFTTEFQGCW